MIYRFGDYQIDTARFEIARAGRALAVEPQVLELLIMLIDNRDHVLSKDEVFGKIWKGRIVSDTTLSSRIKTARQLIGDTGARQQYIKTIHGRGFRFVGDVEIRNAAPPAPAAEPSKAATPERPVTRYARSGDIHVAYHLFGHGPVNLILAPGFVSHIDNYWDSPPFSRWLHRLGELARVAMFDKRGTGLSDPVTSLPGMDERMDDLRAVMDAAGFETAFVMGVSEGGSLAALFAAHHPQRCDGLILYGAFARFKHWHPDEASLQRLFDYVESDWGSGKSLPQFAPSVGDDPEFVHWWGKFERLGGTPGAVISLMKMNSRIDISGILPGIRVPTLVIHRTQDVLVDVAGGRELAAHIPDAELVELPGADHIPFVRGSEDILGSVARFLGRAQARVQSTRVIATVVLVQAPAKSESEAGKAAAATEEELRRFRATRVAACRHGTAATFDGPARALECAVSVSRELRHRGLAHRIGVHTGEVSVEPTPLEGVALEIAADVAGKAASEEILASRTVRDLVAGSGIALHDRGEFQLVSIGERWHLFQVEP